MSAATKTRTNLTGVQRTAVLCVALGPELSAQILKRLSPAELELVTAEIAAMSAVDGETVDVVLNDFYEASKSVSSSVYGGVAYANRLLEQAVGPEMANDLVGRVKPQVAEADLTRFNNASPEALAGVLRGEHPQTIALMLAHLGSRQAASVAQALGPDLAADVLFRVARMQKVSPEMVALVQTGLASKQDFTVPREMTTSGGPGAVAKVLNLMAESLGKQLLESVAGLDDDMAKQIKSLMFVFEDLILIDNKGMQRLLREVDHAELALALKGASDELKKHIRSAMSERAAEALDEELEMLGAVRVRDVEAAHARIIEVVRSLEDGGEIIVRKVGGSDDFIE